MTKKGAGAMGQYARASVIVSGGDAVTPFTTPQFACGAGLAAGNTATAVRETLLRAGIPVFTAPAMNGRSEVREPDTDSFGWFGEMPDPLPAHMTVNSIGDIDNAGEHLARFLGHLHDRFGVREVDLIGHSNGGLFARAAIRIVQETGMPVAVRSLVTLGTPWIGGNPQRIIYGEFSETECQGQASCEAILEGMRAAESRQQGLMPQNTAHYLQGELGWNEAQSGALDGIPVLLIAGTALDSAGGHPEFWPNDGLVSRFSALAETVNSRVLPDRRELELPLLHSIYIADALGEDWQLGMTWNPEVLTAVTTFEQEMRTH